MKKRIDIEKLLQWALREELPKGRPVSASSWDMISQYAALGVRVQTSGPIDGFGFVPGAPHEDALTVAAVIKDVLSDDVTPFEVIDDARAMLAPWNGIAGDAAASLMMATFAARSLVISRAVLGARPPWEFDAPGCYQTLVQGATGRPRAIVEGFDADGDLVALKRREGRALKVLGPYDIDASPRSPLQWLNPSPLSIGHARAEYYVWHCALVTLAHDLAGKLVEFEPVLPAAPAMPWITGAQPAPRVLRSVHVIETVDALPLAPKRHAGGKPIESAIEALSRLNASRSRGKIEKRDVTPGIVSFPIVRHVDLTHLAAETVDPIAV